MRKQREDIAAGKRAVKKFLQIHIPRTGPQYHATGVTGIMVEPPSGNSLEAPVLLNRNDQVPESGLKTTRSVMPSPS